MGRHHSLRSSRVLGVEWLEDRTLLSVSPVELLVGSSAWDVGFLEHLQTSDLGSGGYAVQAGSGSQLKALPWTNLDKISVRFNADAIVRQEYASLRGVNVTEYAFRDFAYDPTTFTATWTLQQPIAQDKLLLQLSDAVRDRAGDPMDGEWINPSAPSDATADTFPAGDGLAGGDFSFSFNILPGDVDQSGATNIFDTIKTRNKQFTVAGQAGYSALHDVDGNGAINILDTIKVRNQQFQGLPSGQPTLAAPRLLVEMATTTLQETGQFSASVFLAFAAKPLEDTTLATDLLCDGEWIASLSNRELGTDGLETVTFGLPSNLLSAAGSGTNWQLRFRVAGLEITQAVVILPAPVLTASLSATSIQEGATFQASVAGASANALLCVDLLHDGELVTHLPNQQVGSEGRATVSLTMPSNLLPDGAREDTYQLYFQADGLETTVPFLLKSAPKLFVDLSSSRIQEGSYFTVNIAELSGTYANTEIGLDLFRDGVLIEGAFDYRELGPDSSAVLHLHMPDHLFAPYPDSGIPASYSEDGFLLRFTVGTAVKEKRITITAAPRLLASCAYPDHIATVYDTTEFWVSFAQGYVATPIGSTAIYASLWHDGVKIRDFADKEFAPDGTATVKWTMKRTNGDPVLPGGYNEDRYDFRFSGAGLPEIEVPVLIKKGSGSNPTPTVPVPEPPPEAAPTTPAPLNLVVRSTTKIDLSWSNSIGESGYRVYRWTGSTWQQIGTTAANVTNYSVTGLSPGKTYSFRVEAYNSAAAITSSTATASTNGVAVTAPIQDADVKSATRIDLKWSASTNATGYKVYKGSQLIATLPESTTSYSVSSGLQPNSYYEFKVIAYNSTSNAESNVVGKDTFQFEPGIYIGGRYLQAPYPINNFFHTAIVLVPNNIDSLIGYVNESLRDTLRTKGYITIGGYADSVIFPTLVVHWNDDAPTTSVLPGDDPNRYDHLRAVQICPTDALLKQILDAAARFSTHTNVDYDYDPDGILNGWNCHSFTFGILRYVGLTPPSLGVSYLLTPGYRDASAVPDYYFQ